jgi:NADH/NAD ratio-sensing transcriptional regulator Rex
MKTIGCAGQRSYGYGIPTLYKAIAEILQLSDKFTAVIIGSTNLAKAIAENHVFSKRGVKLAAVFTEDGRADGFNLLPECEKKKISDVQSYINTQCPNIIILACSTDCAGAVFDFVQSRCVCGMNTAEIWNFTDLELKSERFNVKNIHMSDYLMILCLDAGK